MTEIVASRRQFLKFSGALVVYFTASGAVRGAEEQPPKERTASPDDVQGFLAFHASGEVSVFVGKVDLGTGVQTAMMQIVAEELDVPMVRIRYTQGDTATTPDQGTTSGSFSIERGGVQLRRAAATARHVLLARAADVLHVDRAHLTIQSGIIRTRDGRQIALGDLIKDAPIALPVDRNAPTKTPSDYRIVGKPVRRVDIPDKVTARFTYVQDFRLPGMLHGRVIRPPAIGANLLQVDESSLHDIPGIVQVVRINNFLGVVARTEWAAIRAAQTLAVTWSDAATLPDQAKLWDVVRATPVVHEDVTSATGDVDQALRTAKTTHERVLNLPSRRMVRSGPRVQWPSSMVTRLPAGLLHSRSTRCVTSWPPHLASPRRKCVASISPARDATAAMGTRMRRPMRCCSPVLSANRCAYSGCGPTSTAGTPKVHQL